MGYHPRIETSDLGNFITTRSRNSELWFANNPALEQAILGYTAKFIQRYGVKLYAFAIEGNHIQFPAVFPRGHRADFMRDLNSCTARAVSRYNRHYLGGTFWSRRYSQEFLPGYEDIEDLFFYTVLQPVQDGLVERLSEYPFYNCFHDAVYGIKRKYKVVNWTAYNAAKRYNPTVALKDYVEVFELEYSRLPGYEELSREEYAKLMLKKLEERRQKVVAKRRAEGKGFLGAERLKKVVPGSRPKNTKTSTRYSNRARVLSVCPERCAKTYKWYFTTYGDYKEASIMYRSGKHDVIFPDGMYKPILRTGDPPGDS